MKEWVTKNNYKITRILTGVGNSYLVSNGEKYILIDTSLNFFWKELRDKLEKLGVGSGNLVALILTHTHFDHAENAHNIKAYMNPKVITHLLEKNNLEHGENPYIIGTVSITKILSTINGRNIDWLFKYKPCSVDIEVKDRFELDKLGFKGYILHTPGHTKGSMSIIIDEYAFVGDSMYGVVPKCIKPPFATEEGIMQNSWKRLLDTNCSMYLPGHGGEMKRELLEKMYTESRNK